MQVNVKDIKVKTGITASGKNEGKPWKLIILIGDDGSEFSTFDTGAEEVGIGGVIEFEPIIKAGKINFKEFKIISKGQLHGSADKPNGQPSMTTELWEKKDRLEQWSRECNTCFMGICQIVSNPGVKMVPDAAAKFNNVLIEALDWASLHFTDKPPEATKSTQKPPKEKTSSKTQEPEQKGQDGTFKNLGEFLTACQQLVTKEHPKGISRMQVIEWLGIKENELAQVNLAEAWDLVNDMARGIPF